MKKNNTLSIVVAIILIVVAGILVWNKSYLTTLRGDAADFVVMDTASVTKMFFADKSGNQVLLERHPEYWTVNNEFPAEQRQINEILYTINRLRIRMPVALSNSDNVITRMAGTNTKVEIYQIVPRINLFNKVKLFPHEKCTKTFYIGDVTQDNNGTYVLKEGADKAYIVHLHGFRGIISARFSAKPQDWRGHQIFNQKINDIASLKLEFNKRPEKSFILEENDRYQYTMKSLADGSNIEYDTLKVLNLLTSFSDVRFESFLSDVAPERRDSIIKSPYQERLTLKTKDGKEISVQTYTMKINADSFGLIEEDWDEDPDHKYALVNPGNEFVMIQDFVFGKLLKPAEYYKRGYVEPVKEIYYEELESIPSMELPQL